jgi:hypothetical protein
VPPGREDVVKRWRIPVVVPIAAVAVIALDLAVLRALMRGPDSTGEPYRVPITGTTQIPFATLALGVLPMSSILLVASMIRILGMSRGGTVPASRVGFEAFGWLAVFLFMSGAALSPPAAQGFLLLAASPFHWAFSALLATGPANWVVDGFEMAMCTAFFLLPELLVALAGGWLIGKSSSSARQAEASHPSTTASGT